MNWDMKDHDWGKERTGWDIPRRWQPLVVCREATDEMCIYASDVPCCI